MIDREAINKARAERDAWFAERRAKLMHPVLAELQYHLDQMARWRDKYPDKYPGWKPDPVRRAVVNHGRPYVGIARPKGFRKRKDKLCFANAGDLALDGRGIYVEGFAGALPTHHAWLTIDGVHAIDPTWDNAPDVPYYGIPFPARLLSRTISRRGHWGMLDAGYADMADILAEAVRNPPQ
jgi:hypothetical protein